MAPRRSTPFQTKHCGEYGLEISARDAHGEVASVACRFCISFGREERDAEQSKRKRTSKIKAWKCPFRPELFRQHHQTQHGARWSAYQELAPAERAAFFAHKKQRVGSMDSTPIVLESTPMDFADIPFGVPVILQALVEGKHLRNLKNAFGTKGAVCLSDNQDISEQMILHRTTGREVAILSVRNQCYLRVTRTGCAFDSKELVRENLFTMEPATNHGVWFLACSRSGGWLRFGAGGVVSCGTGDATDWVLALPRSSTPAEQPKTDASPLATKQRHELILELAKCGKSADDIEQLVTRLVDAPASAPPA